MLRDLQARDPPPLGPQHPMGSQELMGQEREEKSSYCWAVCTLGGPHTGGPTHWGAKARPSLQEGLGEMKKTLPLPPETR